MEGDLTQGIGEQPVRILITAHGKHLVRTDPFPFEDRLFAGRKLLARDELLFRVRRRFQKEEMDGLLDDRPLAAKTERGPTERRDEFQTRQSRFLVAFAYRRVRERLSRFRVTFGKGPASERVFDEKDLDGTVPTPKDDPSCGDLVPDMLSWFATSPLGSRPSVPWTSHSAARTFR